MRAYRKGINPNLRTVSLEHEGLSGQTFTEKQYQSTLAVHRFLMAQFNIPADRVYLNGHYQIDSVNRPNCPGSGFSVGTTNGRAQR
jgi:N-acetylmuramoyl-L-alanine amidase